MLIDTPEEIKAELNRSRMKEINACFYSHWHPDHVMGLRIWEALNQSWVGGPLQRRTSIYLPRQVASDFRRYIGTWEHLAFFAEKGIVQLIEMTDGEVVTISNTQIHPFRLAEGYAYGFMFFGEGKRVLIVPDELRGWNPPSDALGADLAIVPMGTVEVNPITGERRIPETHVWRKATFDETLKIARSLKARQVIVTHIEESSGLSFDELKVLEKKLQNEGLNMTFAYDTQLVIP